MTFARSSKSYAARCIEAASADGLGIHSPPLATSSVPAWRLSWHFRPERP
jgi:hypothetical protein